jgi:DNA-binding cell septation regulator SpoVG
MTINEVNIIPIKPTSGLVAFASVVIDNSLYLGSIGVHSRLDGSFRITYPTKKIGSKELNLYHPISRDVGNLIEQAVVAECQQLFKGRDDNDRHNKAGNKNGQTIARKSQLSTDAG